MSGVDTPPKGHPLRDLARVADQAIDTLAQAATSQRLPPDLVHREGPMLRALLLQAAYGIPAERAWLERLHSDAHCSWFVAPGADAALRETEAFSRRRAALFATGLGPSFIQRVLTWPKIARVLLDPRLAPDPRLLEAWSAQEGWRAAADTDGAVGSLLLLPHVPDALRHLSFLEADDGTTPLEAVLRRLRDGAPGTLAVACWSSAMFSAVAAVAERCGARALLLEPQSRLAQLLAAAAALHTSHLALWQAGAALLAPALVRRLCAHHLQHANDVTTTPSFPNGVGAEIYSAWCLHRLRASAPKTVDFGPSELLDWAQRVASQRPYVADLRQVAWPEAAPLELPARVVIAEDRDWRRLAACLTSRTPHKEGEWALVEAWHRAGAQMATAPRRRPASRLRHEPRVLFVAPSVAFSGPERMYTRLANGLLDRGVDLWGLVVRPGLAGALLRPAYRDRLLSDGVEFGRATLASFDYCLEVYRKVRPDIVHCNGVLTWPALAAARASGTPLVQHARIADFSGFEDNLRAASHVLAVSQFVAAEVRRVGVDPERVRLCYDGIDPARYRRTTRARDAGRRRFGLAPHAFVVLCLARCTRSKRIDVVLAAFAHVARTRRDTALLVVGEIEDALYYQELEASIAAHGLSGRVRFLQAVEDVRGLHAAADAVMLASLGEALGTAVLEGMSMGTPVIASASGGILELIDETCGTLVAPDDIEGFGAALMRVARGDRELLGKATRAREVVARRFTLAQHVETVRRLYLEVVR